MASDGGFNLWHGVHRFSYETVALPRSEDMGLAGLHYLVDLSPHLYAGLGMYGAVVGNRGGFFTVGFEAGMRQTLFDPIIVEAGLFIGGGGGRSAYQGGGLMLRPHVGLIFAFENIHLGFEYALVDFPNGEISSSHAAVLLELPFDTLRVQSEHPEDLAGVLERASRAANREVLFDRERLTARYQVYSPPDRVMNVGGVSHTGAFQMMGFEYSRDLGKRSYLFIETSGAVGGNADGYAEVLLGGGFRVPLFARRIFLDSRGSLGAGGGGKVDTGGGGLGKASLGLTVMAGDFSIDARAGYVESVGAFRAQTAEIGLSYAFDAVALGSRGMTRFSSADKLQAVSWRTRLSYVQYTSMHASMRKNLESGDISLLGAKIDMFPGAGSYYLTGQMQSAFAGNAGGYCVGLMGIGYMAGPPAKPGVHVFAEALGGAAGGGGIEVGGGAVVQPVIGVLVDISERAGLEASIGRIRALHGELDSTVAGLSFVYRFSTAGRKTTDAGDLSGGAR
jgi:hypothetical protein